MTTEETLNALNVNASAPGANDQYIFENIGNICSSLKEVTNLLRKGSVEEKIVTNIAKRKTKINKIEDNISIEIGNKIYKSKCVNVTFGANNLNNPIMMSGLKNAFGQMLGGKSAYATLNIISDDPKVISDIISLFRSNSIYDQLNNMISQTRSLLKTKGPLVPDSIEFQNRVNQKQQISSVAIKNQLRALSKSIKKEQLFNILNEIVNNSEDLEYDQTEPLIIKHNFLNSLGYYTFVPTELNIETVPDGTGELSLVIQCQWVNQRIIYKEALRLGKKETPFKSHQMLSWYNSLYFDELRNANTRDISNVSPESGWILSGSWIKDYKEKKEYLIKSTKFGKAVSAKQSTAMALAPILVSYALYQFKQDFIDSLSTGTLQTSNIPTPFLNKILENQTIIDRRDIIDDYSLYEGGVVAVIAGTLSVASSIKTSSTLNDLRKNGKVGLKSGLSASKFTLGSDLLIFLALPAYDAYKYTNSTKESGKLQYIENNITYTNDLKVATNNYILDLNIPYICSTYYIQFVKEMLLIYDNESLLKSKLLEWASIARSLFSTPTLEYSPKGNLAKLLPERINNNENTNAKMYDFIFTSNSIINN